MTKEEKVKEILKRLYKEWPTPKTELQHSNALELLFATILSAQTLDKSVNAATPALFAKFKTLDDYVKSSPEEIDTFVTKINFHKGKSKNIFNAAKLIKEQFGGNVPQTMEELITLPGVARKTANVVLGSAFNKQVGVVVDTHVRRLSQLLGLTTENDPVKVEKDLMEVVPQDKWTDFSHLLILYGRYKCPARKDPKECPILTDLFV